MFLTPPLLSQECATFPSFISALAGRQGWSVISHRVYKEVCRASVLRFPGGHSFFQCYLTVLQENATARVGGKWNL